MVRGLAAGGALAAYAMIVFVLVNSYQSVSLGQGGEAEFKGRDYWSGLSYSYAGSEVKPSKVNMTKEQHSNSLDVSDEDADAQKESINRFMEAVNDAGSNQVLAMAGIAIYLVIRLVIYLYKERLTEKGELVTFRRLLFVFACLYLFFFFHKATIAQVKAETVFDNIAENFEKERVNGN